jgi:hypothetical protein
MRASAADPIDIIPDDCRLVSLTAFAAAIGVREKKARAVLAEEGIPIVRAGARSGGIRLSEVRRVLKRRERARA